MTILCIKKSSENFDLLEQEFIKDARLSFTAVGLLGQLFCSFKNLVDFDELANKAPDGREAIEAAFSELKTCGYVVNAILPDRHYFGADYTVYLTPHERGVSNNSEGR